MCRCRLLRESCKRRAHGPYRLEHDGVYHILWQRHASGAWERNYRFTLVPRQYADFEAMCQYHQTSPQSLFTQKRLCTRATPKGRITLDDRRLITTISGQRQERALTGEDEFWELAQSQFNIELGRHLSYSYRVSK